MQVSLSCMLLFVLVADECRVRSVIVEVPQPGKVTQGIEVVTKASLDMRSILIE